MSPVVSPDATGVAAFALRNRRAVVCVLLGLCVWGTAAMFTLPTGLFPDLAFPRIVVIAERGEDAVPNVMIGMTRPLEEAVSAVPGLTRVRSKTIRGAAELALDFAPDTDIREALAQTRARVAATLSALPAGVHTMIEQQTPSIFPVLSFNVTWDPARGATGRIRDLADLRQWVEQQVKPRLSRMPEVFLVTVQGSDERVIAVEADPARLAGLRIGLDALVTALRDANAMGAVGRLERDHWQVQLLVTSELLSLDDIGAVPVLIRDGAVVRVRDVADVRLGSADRTRVVSGNGRDAVVVSLFLRPGGRITGLSDAAGRELADLKPALPAGVDIQPVYDEADLVRASLIGVRDAILLGMALAVLVLWVFLGSWRLTLTAAVSIPVSVLGALACMSAFGESLNLMSLGGIAVAIGLIIDDAIVVAENIARLLGTGGSREDSVVAATQEVFGAVVGSSLTTVVVFLPLIWLEGVVGQFFRAMASALVFGIAASLVVSLTLTPILAAGSWGPRAGAPCGRAWTVWLAAVGEAGVRMGLRHPTTAAAALLLVVLVGAWGSWSQQTGFLPPMDEGGFVLDYTMPVGTSLSETDANCRRIEAVLARTPEVRAWSRRTGAELGFFATEQFTGDFLVALTPAQNRACSSAAVVDRLREAIAREVPQIEVSFVQVLQDTINDLAGNPAPIEVKVFGPEVRALQVAARDVSRELERIPGVVDVACGVSFGSPELNWRLDRDAVGRVGLSSEEVESQLHTALYGETATTLRRGEALVPVVVRYPEKLRNDARWLERFPVFDHAGRAIPISALARAEEVLAENELARENLQPVVSVEANLEQRDLGSAAAEVRAVLSRLHPPAGVRFELSGQVENQEHAFRSLLGVILIAIGLVFLLLVAQFRSCRLSFVLFLSLPYSQIGALLALRVTGTALDVSAAMGLLLLIGLVVKNGIILIEYAAQIRLRTGCMLEDALAQAARVRLRPILMTSATAVAALLPLACNIGAGAELQRPLAIAVIGGLSVSTLFTLLVVPVAHLIVGEPAHATPAPVVDAA